MKLQVAIVGLAAGFAAAVPATAAAQRAQAIAEDPKVINQLINDPNLLPLHARTILADAAKKLVKRQSDAYHAIVGSLLNGVWNWNRAKPPTKVPEVHVTNSTYFPGSIRKKIRYGPYRVPPVSEPTYESMLLNVKGISNTLLIGAKKPCDGDCLLLALNASIEYDDGRPAENENGAWFHHGVLLNVGPYVQEAVCGGNYMENMFMSGNEKTEAKWALPDSPVKSGYHLRKSDTFILNTELMNLDEKEKWVWLTLTFDYLDGPHPEYKDGKVVWMSIGPHRCTGSDSNPFGVSNLTKTQQPTKDTFYEYSIPWVVPRDGLILGTTGHMHDGGTSTEIFKNGEVICDSKPYYTKNNKPGMGGMSGNGIGGMGAMGSAPAAAPAGGHSHGAHKRQAMGGHGSNNDNEHIDSQPPCIFQKPIEVKKGDTMWIKANYDFTKHKGMKNAKGELDEVMSIVGTLMAF